MTTPSYRPAKGTDKPLGEIAAELGVDAIVEGSALRVGDRVRIMAQLIDPETNKALWADSYERDLQDVLLLQSEVAKAIAREIEVAVSPEETARLASARPVNPEAHDHYLKGLFHSQKLTGADLDTALSYFELALEKDPDYAPAYVGIARVWSIRRGTGYASPREANPKSKAGILKALELDESLAEAHFALARYKISVEWDWPSGERAFERAFELNPNHAEGRARYSQFLNIMGRPDEAMAQIERALEHLGADGATLSGPIQSSAPRPFHDASPFVFGDRPLDLIMLAGIVVNNAIILVDTTNRLRREGRAKIEALKEAGKLRLRPILMTTSTTVLGLLPMAVGLGEGSELRAPMAITVIGGLLVATVLTLVIIPAVYSVVDRTV